MKRILLGLVIAFISAASSTIAAQTYKVIVNTANTTESVSKEDLSKIFLKKKGKWEDGSSIIPIDLGDRNPTREAFSKEVHGKGTGEIKTFWQQASFAGEGNPPLERPGDEDVIKFVQMYPGPVGYVSAYADVSGVKVITVN